MSENPQDLILELAHQKKWAKRIIKLSLCPFCGGSARAVRIHQWDGGDFSVSYVKCGRCDVRTKSYRTHEAAIKRWNTRVEQGEKG